MALTAFKPAVLKAERTVVKSQEILHSYSAGETIFSQGDPGGDLLFIESGVVEIFMMKNNQEISLAQMNQGEIIGVMTFLTRDTRLASARALVATKIKKIPSQHVQKYIHTFPRWLKIVLKEFVGRINEMNRKYSETIMELKKAKELQITPLFLATQLASGCSIIAQASAKSKDGRELVFYDDIVAAAQLMLNQPKKMVESLMEIFEVSDLLTFDSDLGKKQHAFDRKTFQNLIVFTQFVRDSGQGQTRKILKAGLSATDKKVLRGLARYLIAKSNPIDKAGVVMIDDLGSDFDKLAGIKYSHDSVIKVSKTGVLTLKEDAPRSISLIPCVVLTTIACIEAMQRLNGEDESSEPPVPVESATVGDKKAS